MKKKNLYFNLVLPKLKGKLCFENIEISIGRNIYTLLTHNKCIFRVIVWKCLHATASDLSSTVTSSWMLSFINQIKTKTTPCRLIVQYTSVKCYDGYYFTFIFETIWLTSVLIHWILSQGKTWRFIFDHLFFHNV